MGSFRVDDSHWPVVIHSVDGVLDDAQIDGYAAAGTEVLLRRQPHVVIIDVRAMGRVSAYGRARNAGWIKQYHAELTQYCLGTAYVIRSPLLRFITMTVLLVSRLPTPYTVCETLEDALAWSEKRMIARARTG